MIKYKYKQTLQHGKIPIAIVIIHECIAFMQYPWSKNRHVKQKTKYIKVSKMGNLNKCQNTGRVIKKNILQHKF